MISLETKVWDSELAFIIFVTIRNSEAYNLMLSESPTTNIWKSASWLKEGEATQLR